MKHPDSIRRTTLKVLCTSMLAALPLAGPAQTPDAVSRYPARPIKLIVPFAPGGGVDLMARLAAQQLGDQLGQPVVVENQAGAGGTVGTAAVARAAPDGYTLLFHTTSSAVINAVVFTNLSFDPVTSFAPVTLMSRFPLAVFVNPDVPAKDMREFVALLKANPQKYNYGSSGYGSIVHLGAELFKSLAQVELTHIPYKGNAPALADLMAGRVTMMIDGVPPQLGNIAAGKVRALAVTTTTRSEVLPNVPTMIESGIPGYELSFWNAIFAPAGTPKPIVDRISREMAKIMAKPEVLARMKELGSTGIGSTPEELNKLWQDELTRYRKIVKESGIKLTVDR
ncbi:MAG: tripartite tricarboxylate transporter substrate binding protein [Pseudomonadota bacterium]